MKNKLFIYLIFLSSWGLTGSAQDSVQREMILNLSYNMPADLVPYLKVTAKEKVGRQFISLKGINAIVYIGEQTETGLIEKVTTDEKGDAFIFIPPAFKSAWDSPNTLNFYVVTDANKDFQSTSSELQVTKAKIEIDTATEDDVKYIKAKVIQLKDGNWVPAPDVELKISVKRSLGNLPISGEDSYTTDTAGEVSAEFDRDSLYGDDKGDLRIIVRTEDNDTYGNIRSEKIVNWGKAPIIDHTFFTKRSLWAPRFKTPFWLLGLAYGIIGAVWGTLIYLIIQIIKIRKLGRTTT